MVKFNIFNCNPLGEKTAVALGVFDGVHIGHRRVIKTAVDLRKKGLTPTVFTFDTQTVIKRGSVVLPIMSDVQKEKIMENLGVEVLVSSDFEKVRDYEPERFVKEILADKLNAKAVVCGEDFCFGKGARGNCEALKKFGEKYGFEVFVIPAEIFQGEVVSSSRIRKALEQGEISLANKMLGEVFSMELEVVHGKQLGRTWNFPTINQEIDPKYTPLKFGVYASKVYIDGKVYNGVTNIGVKPTVNVITKPLAETFIMGFEGDLYGRVLKLELYEFIRAERKFASFEELKEEIGRNKAFAKKYFERIDLNEQG